MSDSFADLWASTAPTKPTTQAQPSKLTPYDAFSILSASQPNSRANKHPVDRPARQRQQPARADDAFSALFAPSLDGAAADRTNMTMAERAALAQKAKDARPNAVANPGPSAGSLWDGLDTLARPATTSPRPPASQDDFDFGFDGAPQPEPSPVPQDDDWGLSEFASRPSEPRPASKPPSTRNLWDLDDFRTRKPQPPSRSLTGTPGDFDFGDREDALLGDVDSDVEDTFGIRGGRSEDDILGDLSKPVSHTPSPNPSASAQAPTRPPRTASPPPHIIGQLVEMGFSPFDARAALANTTTDSGFDVQAAAELLLSQASQEASSRPPSHPPDRELRRNGDRATRRPPLTQGDSTAQPPAPVQSPPQPQLDITAEKLLSQATEIGRGMFSKANALWKEGKERAVKIYEERATAANATSGTPASDGRPRWMRDRDHVGPETPQSRDAIQAGFKDDEGEGQAAEREQKQRPPPRRPPHRQPQSASQSSQPEQEIDLFNAVSPTTVYQSPYRRGKPKTQVSSPSAQSSLSPPMVSTPPRPPRTFTTTIALSAFATSTSHKSSGTDAYKRGDFPVALAAYTRALAALPSDHVLRVPILTNVALVRTKEGELRETVKACEEAVVIVRRFVGSPNGEGGDMSYLGASEFDERTPVDVGSGKVSVSTQGDASNGDLPTSIDLSEALSKAYRRRAEALEGLEKWDGARRTWEVVLGAEWANGGVKGEAIKGVGRCRRMINGDEPRTAPKSIPNPTPAPRPRPKPKPKSTPNAASNSAAVAALRSTQDAQQTEDVARLACKDTVDARLSAWKNGREGNIRALLTSLDESVLWPELGWRKVGMAEVVSKGQVKGAYVRAIAKVHPDKLNAGNTTMEQRMIANGVFGALNEAWNVFQQQVQ